MEEETANPAAPTVPDPISEVVQAYNEATYVDNSAIIKGKLAQLAGFVVTPQNTADAKKVRARLKKLVEEAAAARMKVQRAIKSHPIGEFAFTKGELEKSVEAEHKRLDSDIKHMENAPSVRVAEEVDTYVCFITGTLLQINKLAVHANEQGLAFENRGPALPEPPPQRAPAPAPATTPGVPPPAVPPSPLPDTGFYEEPIF